MAIDKCPKCGLIMQAVGLPCPDHKPGCEVFHCKYVCLVCGEDAPKSPVSFLDTVRLLDGLCDDDAMFRRLVKAALAKER